MTSLCKLFNHTLSSGNVPSEWKASNVTAVFKSGDKSWDLNHRHILLISIPSNILEHIFHRRLLWYLVNNSILPPKQFGFRSGSSTLEALLTAIHEWQSHLDRGLIMAALFLDMSKAFDKVPHDRLLLSLTSVGVSSPLLKWCLSNHTQRIVLSGHSSSLPVESGVPQGSILGPLLLIIYVTGFGKPPVKHACQIFATGIFSMSSHMLSKSSFTHKWGDQPLWSYFHRRWFWQAQTSCHFQQTKRQLVQFTECVAKDARDTACALNTVSRRSQTFRKLQYWTSSKNSFVGMTKVIGMVSVHTNLCTLQ